MMGPTSELLLWSIFIFGVWPFIFWLDDWLEDWLM